LTTRCRSRFSVASLIRFVSDHSSYRVATALVIGVWVTAVAGPSGDMTLQLEVCGEVRTGLAEIDDRSRAADQHRAVPLANLGVRRV
jgi:hypothetical protein